jgi:tRNA(Ile2) C34 agmatinyltransferase TiaS
VLIKIGLDDTDVPGTPGTGHLARELAEWLRDRFEVIGVTRHQLLKDDRVPMTSKNSSAAIHLEADHHLDLETVALEVAERVRGFCAPGSDPGVCLAQGVPEAVMAFGWRAKVALVTQVEARSVASEAGLILRGLGGDGGGVIGALAAVGLSSSENDGRFIDCNQMREMSGLQEVRVLLEAGVVRVQTDDGKPVAEGLVDTGNGLRPSLVGGRPVLWVEWQDGHWRAVRRD